MRKIAAPIMPLSNEDRKQLIRELSAYRRAEREEERRFSIEYEKNRRRYAHVMTPQQVYHLTYSQMYPDNSPESMESAEHADYRLQRFTGRGRTGGPKSATRDHALMRSTILSDPRDYPDPNKPLQTPSSEYLYRAEGNEPSFLERFEYFRDDMTSKGMPLIKSGVNGTILGVKNLFTKGKFGTPYSDLYSKYKRQYYQPARYDARIPLVTEDFNDYRTNLNAQKVAYWPATLLSIGGDVLGFDAGVRGARGLYNVGKGLYALNQVGRPGLNLVRNTVAAQKAAGRLAAKAGAKVLNLAGPAGMALYALTELNEAKKAYGDLNLRTDKAYLDNKDYDFNLINNRNLVTGLSPLNVDATNPYKSYGGAVNNFPHLLFPTPQRRPDERTDAYNRRVEDAARNRNNFRELQRLDYERRRLNTNYDQQINELGRLQQQLAQDRNDTRLFREGKYDQLMNTRKYQPRNMKEHGTTVPDFNLPTESEMADSARKIVDLRNSLAETRRRRDYINREGVTMNDYNNTDFSK